MKEDEENKGNKFVLKKYSGKSISATGISFNTLKRILKEQDCTRVDITVRKGNHSVLQSNKERFRKK
jgi:hypothetical protein